MAVKFPQYLKEHGLLLLLASDAKFLLGVVAEKEGDAFWAIDDLRRLLKDDPLSWELDLVEADMPDEIVGRRAVDAGGTLELPFLSIGGGLKGSSTVDFAIGSVTKREFKDDVLRLWAPLSQRLAKLRQQDPAAWAAIKGRYLVLSTWYATEYSLHLGRALSGSLDAAFKENIAVKAGAKVSLDQESKIVNVKGNDRVPFAFHGKRLVKIG